MKLVHKFIKSYASPMCSHYVQTKEDKLALMQTAAANGVGGHHPFQRRYQYHVEGRYLLLLMPLS